MRLDPFGHSKTVPCRQRNIQKNHIRPGVHGSSHRGYPIAGDNSFVAGCLHPDGESARHSLVIFNDQYLLARRAFSIRRTSRSDKINDTGDSPSLQNLLDHAQKLVRVVRLSEQTGSSQAKRLSPQLWVLAGGCDDDRRLGELRQLIELLDEREAIPGGERDIQQNQIRFDLHSGTDRGDAIYRDPRGITIRFEPHRQRECQPVIVLNDKYLFHGMSGY